MYHVEDDDGILIVIHDESEEFMRYSSNATDTKNLYEAINVNGYYDMFWPWVYEYSTKDRKKVLYEMYNTQPISPMMPCYDIGSILNTFVAPATCPPSVEKAKYLSKYGAMEVKKKEEDMPTCTKSDAMIQRDYLASELRTVSATKRIDAEKTFGLRDDDRPNTFTQLLARITSGKYTIDDKYKDRNTYGCPTEYIRWRDPAVKEDQAGYDAFVKAVQVAATATERTIKIAEPAAGLDALIAFEAMTFSPTVH